MVESQYFRNVLEFYPTGKAVYKQLSTLLKYILGVIFLKEWDHDKK
jgi:hypothetical protein